MSRAQKQRRTGRKGVNATGSAKGLPAGVTKQDGTEKFGPVGGPKGPSDPGARVVKWG